MTSFDIFKSPKVCLLLLVLATLAIFANGLGGEFVYDDVQLVKNNRALRNLSSIPQAFVEFFRPKSVSHFDREVDLGYRPVRNASYAVDYFFTRLLYPNSLKKALSPTVFHFTNLFLHVLNGILLFSVLYYFTKNSPAALVGSLLFALHPVQTESVIYISGRRDVLSGFFLLLSLVLYLYKREKLPWRFAILPLFGLALLTKETAIVLPVILFVYAWWHDREDIWPLDKKKGAFWLILALVTLGFLYFKLFYKNPTDVGLARSTYWGGSFYSTLLTIPRALWFYLGLVAFPLTLSVDYSYRAFLPSSSLINPLTTLPALLGTVALVGLLLYYRKREIALGGWWFLIFLLPVSQLVPHPERLAEHYLYLPLAGMGLIIALVGTKIKSPGGQKASALAALLILALLGARTVDRNRDWQNSYTLWKSAVEAYPQCGRAQMAFGQALLDRGDGLIEDQKIEEAKKAWQKAQKHLHQAIEIVEGRPGRPRAVYLNALFFYGVSHLKMGEWKEAQEILEKLMALKNARGQLLSNSPQHTHIHLNLAAACRQLGNPSRARKLYQKILELDSKNPVAHLELGQMAVQRKEYNLAQKKFRQALKLSRDRPDIERKTRLALSVLLINQGQVAEARALLHPLLQQDEAPHAHFLMAKALLHQGKRKKSLDHLQKGAKAPQLSPSLAISMARAFLTLRQKESAEKLLTQVSARHPQSLALTTTLIEVKFTLGRHQEALDLINSLPRLNSHLLYLKGRIYEEEKKLQAAADLYETNLKEKLHLPSALARIRLAYGRGKKEGRKRAQKLLQRFPNQEKFWLAVGRLFVRQKDFNALPLHFQRGQEKFPNSDKIKKAAQKSKVYKSRLYHQLLEDSRKAWKKGREERARRLVNQALEIDYSRAEGHEWKGRLLFQKEEYKEAQLSLSRALARKDYGTLAARLHYMIGYCHYRNDQLEKSLEATRQALSLFPGYPPALKVKALACEKKGAWKESLEMWQKYLKTPLSSEEKTEIDRKIKKIRKKLNSPEGEKK